MKAVKPERFTFELCFINVDQLLRNTEVGYYMEMSKTDNRLRQALMNATSYEAFKRVLKNRRGEKA